MAPDALGPGDAALDAQPLRAPLGPARSGQLDLAGAHGATDLPARRRQFVAATSRLRHPHDRV
jgi:hypothetical protein